MEHPELVQQTRGMLQRGVVGSVDDSGDVQTVELNTGDDVGRTLVEVHQPYGLASLPPEAQPLTLVLSIGGDQGHQMALHLWSATRFGKLARGEVALYDAGANRLHLKAGGNVDLLAAALLKAASLTMQLAAQQTVVMTAGTTMTIGALEGLSISAGGSLTAKAEQDLGVTAGGTMTLAAQQTAALTAGGAMVIGSDALTVNGPVTFTGPVTFAQTATFEADVTIAGNLTVGGVITGIGRYRGEV